jgi:predicted phage-related endonuclease
LACDIIAVKGECNIMEDKTFELLTKMYSEFTDFRKETSTRLDGVEGSIKALEQGQKRIEVTLENDIKPKINALFDGYQQTYETLQDHGKKLDNITAKVDTQEIEIKVLKGGRAIK